MTTSFQSQRVLTPEDLGALAVSSTVNHIVGANVAMIRRPTTGQYRNGLVLFADRGNWRLSVADRRQVTFSTVNTTTDQATVTSHGFYEGDGPVRLTTSGSIPAGLSVGVDYWIKYIDANTISFYTSAAKTTIADITGTGAGTQTICAEGGAMPTTEVPASTVSDGSGCVFLREGSGMVLPGPNVLTVKGFVADSTLTYYWI